MTGLPDTVAQSGPTASPNPAPLPVPIDLSTAIGAAAAFAGQAEAARDQAVAAANEMPAAVTAAVASAISEADAALAAAVSTATTNATNEANTATTQAGIATSAATTSTSKATEASGYVSNLLASISATVSNGVTANPFWLDGLMPSVILSAPKGATQLSGGYVADTSLFTISSGTKRVIGPTGTLDTVAANSPAYDYSTGRRRLLIEAVAATNLLLNSATLTSQSIAVAAGSVTISFWGTATVTLSGAATGTVTGSSTSTRTMLTVTATAGTLTMTVTGAGTNGQVETGPVATSYIPTTGASVTRISDDVRLSSAALAIANAAGGATIALRCRLISAASYARILGDPTTDVSVMIREAANDGIGISSPAGSAWIYGGASLFADVGVCAAYSSSGKKISKAGRTPVSSATAFPALGGLRIFGGYVGGYANGYLDELVIWPLVGSDAGIQSQARVYA